jgi:hypothetical protein
MTLKQPLIAGMLINNGRYRLCGSALEGSRQLFIQKALPWLRFLGRLEQPDNEPIPFTDLIKDFAAYMRNQRGLSSVTIRNRCWHVETFLDWLRELNRSFAEVSIRIFFFVRCVTNCLRGS